MVASESGKWLGDMVECASGFLKGSGKRRRGFWMD